MRTEIEDILERNSKQNLAKISSQELGLLQQAISSFIDLVENSQTLEEGEVLLNKKFGFFKNTIFHLAAKFGVNDQLQRLLQMVANDKIYVDIKNEGYLTPLHLAAKEGQIVAVEILIAAGADLSHQASVRNRGWAPIHYAARGGYTKIVNLFINAGVDKEVKTMFGLTPLHIACEFGHLEVVQFLFSIGAEINSQTKEENHHMTPLHHAVVGNFKNVVLELLKHGANKEIETTLGFTAIELAAKNDLLEIVELLLSFGAGRWDMALKIAQKNKADETVKLIKKYQKISSKCFDLKWMKRAQSEIVSAIMQFNLSNLWETKIILPQHVVFNAYGFLALKKQLGFFKKEIQILPQFIKESGMKDLNEAVKKLVILVNSASQKDRQLLFQQNQQGPALNQF